MKPKTFRDLHKKKLSNLVIGEGKTVPKKSDKPREAIDLSMIDSMEPVFPASKKILDIQKKNAEGRDQKVMFLEVKEKNKSRDRLSEIIRMTAAGVVILFIINIVNIYERGLTIKNDVIATAFSGYNNLVQAGNESKSAQFPQAENSFTTATQNFQDALSSIQFLETNKNAFFGQEKTVESAQNLLQAGENISEAGNDFAKGILHLQELPKLFFQNNAPLQTLNNTKPQLVNDSNVVVKVSLTKTLSQDLGFLQQASSEVDAASQNLSNVSPDVLPEPLKSKLGSVQDSITKLQDLLQQIQEKMPVILEMLGDRYLQRYLILLQNDAEARPTGGFIGSYLIVDVKDGYITNTEFHDIYETDGQLQENIPAPADIAKITKNWRMRDSNYSPDFAISAEKAAWFLQKENGPSVDSVISINQSLIAKLFAITGPVTVDGLKVPLNKDNYETIISYLVESKLSGAQDPKKILRSFIPAFESKLLASHDVPGLLKIIVQALQERDIMMYSRYDDIENFFDQLGVSGKVIRTQPGDDFLQIITTSIGGNKSDLYMQQEINHSTLIAQDGTVTDQVVLTRKHTWTADVLTQWQQILNDFGFTDLTPGIQSILGSGENKSVIKVYVPEGSALMSTAGVDQNAVQTEQDTDLQKSYFMFEMDIPAGTEQTVTLNYQLPVKLNLSIGDTYRFYAQRQPGIVLSNLDNNIFVSPGLKFLDYYPQDLQFPQKNQAYQSGPLINDDFISVLVGPDN